MEKHTFRCRDATYSCIDCQQHFEYAAIHLLIGFAIFRTPRINGTEVPRNRILNNKKNTYICSSYSYAQHLKCITEDQKYGGKNFVAKEAKVRDGLLVI